MGCRISGGARGGANPDVTPCSKCATLRGMVRIAILILLSALTACTRPDLKARVRALEVEADRETVARLAHGYAHGIDEMNEVLLRRTFTENAVAEYKGANFPMDLRLEGIDAILEWLRSSVGDRDGAVPWHFMSTHLVDIDGDEATLRTFQHNRHMSGVGLYTIQARRTKDGWRIVKLHLDERILDPKLLERLHSESTGPDPVRRK